MPEWFTIDRESGLAAARNSSNVVREAPRPMTPMDGTVKARRIGLALSGGGAKGSFQLGALRYVIDHHTPAARRGHFDVIAGTSVGAVNGVKIAEDTTTSIDELETLWKEMRKNDDMFLSLVPVDKLGSELEKDVSSLATGVLEAHLVPFAGVFLFADGVDKVIRKYAAIVDNFIRARLSTFSPLRTKLAANEARWSVLGPGRRLTPLRVAPLRAAAHVSRGAAPAPRFLLVARGYDRQLHVMTMTSTTAPPPGQWWRPLGRTLTGEPMIELDADGFAQAILDVGADRRLARLPVARLFEPGDPTADWAPFGPGHTTDVTPFAYRAVRGQHIVFGESPRGLNVAVSPNFVWHAVPSPMIDGVPAALAGVPAAWMDAEGRMRLLVRSTSHGRLCEYERQASGEWRQTPTVPGIATCADPMMVALGDGAHLVAWVNERHAVSVCRRSGASWGEVRDHGGSITSNLDLDHHGGSARIFGRGLDDQYWVLEVDDHGQLAPGWTPMPTAPEAAAGDLALVRGVGFRGAFAVFAGGHPYLAAEHADGFGQWQRLSGTLDVGPELRLAAVDLRDGILDYFDEAGQTVGRLEEPVSRTDAVLASASIPAMFEHVTLNGRPYVDGGMISSIPIAAVVEAGVDEIYAIACSPPRQPHPKVGVAGHWSAMEALIAMPETMATAINELELYPPNGWGLPVHVIRPTVDVHDSFKIEPDLLLINHQYGQMRAADVLAPGHGPAAAASSDAITSARVALWKAERALLFAAHATAVAKQSLPLPGSMHDRGDPGPHLRLAEAIQELRTRWTAALTARLAVSEAVAARQQATWYCPPGVDASPGAWACTALAYYAPSPLGQFKFYDLIVPLLG